MTSRRFLTFVLIIAGITAFAWLAVPSPVAVGTVLRAEGQWKVPLRPAINVKELIATLSNANLWGKLADIPQPSDIEPEWRFIGAMVRGQERYVIIKKDNLPEQTLVAGDILPGGSKILSVESDRLCLLINGQKRNLYIYPQGRLSGKMANVAEEPPIRQTASAARHRSP